MDLHEDDHNEEEQPPQQSDGDVVPAPDDEAATDGNINPEDIEEVIDIAGDDRNGAIDDDDDDGDDDDDDGEEGEGNSGEHPDAAEETVEANAEMIIQNHNEPVYAVATNGTIGVSGGQDDTAVVFSLEDGSLIHKITAHSDSVIAVAFSSNGEYLATGSLDGAVKVWSMEWEQVLDLDIGDDLTCMAFHPAAPFLIAGSNSGTAVMWHIPTGRASYFQAHSASISGCAWAPNGRSFVTIGEDGLLVSWSPKSASVIQKIDAKADHRFHNCPVVAAACHPDNTVVATGGADGSVVLSNLKTGHVVGGYGDHTDNVESIVFSNTNPTLMASASLDGNIHVYNATTKHKQCTMEHEAGVVKLLFHPTLPILFSCSLDSSVKIWDARNGALLHTCTGHMSHVLDMAIISDGNRVVSAGEEGDVLVFAIPDLSSASSDDH